MRTDPCSMTAADLGASIEAGRLDPRDLTEQFLDAIDRHPHGGAIYARVTSKRARMEADQARSRAKSGMRLHPLDGVPISWKDLFDTKNVATEAGTRLLAGRTPTKDAGVLERATAKGIICLGKTHMTEFAFSGLGINPMTATPPNCFDETRAPGGSSSGAATSVAFSLAAIGIGSDTGGSVRIPACWNSLVGFKTTAGRIPNDGVVPLCENFDTIGPLTRTVEDAALMFSVLDNNAMPGLEPASLAGCRFLIVDPDVLEGCDDDQRNGFEDAVGRLQRCGATIVRQAAPEYRSLLPLGPQLFPFEAWRNWGDTITAAPEKIHKPVRERFQSGASISETDYRAAYVEMERVRTCFWTSVAEFDGILSPTTACNPPVTKELLADDDLFASTNLLALRNTRFGNMLGACAITLPTTIATAGLMISTQPMGEERLLQIASAAERIVCPDRFE